MSRGRARIAIGQGLGVWVLEAGEGFGDAGFHAHHAIQLTVCLNGRLALGTGSQTLTGPAIAVAADARHRLDAEGLLAIVFVEPESAVGRTLASKLFATGNGLSPIDHTGFFAAMEGLSAAFDSSDDRLIALAQRALGELAPITCLRQPDARVRQIIDYASTHLDEPLTLQSASRDVYLSPSRLRHLFVEQTGLAFRTYVLWLRMVRAVSIYAKGQSLTEAAHGAGFSDSAHFSRVFKRTFGLPATTLTRL